MQHYIATTAREAVALALQAAGMYPTFTTQRTTRYQKRRQINAHLPATTTGLIIETTTATHSQYKIYRMTAGKRARRAHTVITLATTGEN